MEPTLKREIDGAEFKETRRGGYDRGEVDDFLDRIAEEVGRLEARAAQASERARAAEGRLNQLESDLEAEVQHRLASRAPGAPAATGPSEEESADQLKRTLILAQRTADAAIKEARDESARVVSEAEAKGRSIVDDANAEAVRLRDQTEGETRRQRVEAREGLVVEIQKLESTRDILKGDVDKLEQHLGSQRSQLKASVDRLQKIIDEPKAFALDPAPELAKVEMPVEDEPEPRASVPAPPSPPPVARPATPPAPAAPAEPATAPAVPPAGTSRPTTGSVRIDAPRADAPRGAGSAGGFEEVDHEAPGTGRGDPGPPTRPVSAVELGIDEPAEADPFLAELRKAMDDDEPLGPTGRSESSDAPGLFDQDDSAKGRRFGRRGR